MGDVLWRARVRSPEQKLCGVLPRLLLRRRCGRDWIRARASDSVLSSPGRPCLTTMRRARLRDQDGGAGAMQYLKRSARNALRARCDPQHRTDPDAKLARN